VDAQALDRDVCREHLAEVLAEEAGLLDELRTLLEREYEVLGTKDAILHGYSADYAGLEGLIVWCDPQGTLISRLRECAKLAADCRDLNERNGTLVAAKLKRVEGLLGALTGRSSSADTYNANGSNAPTRPGRVLGAA
jgi:flagellar biosynthesis/type III secretory pathway chaperone